MTQPKYQRKHYQDVAQILRAAYQWEDESCGWTPDDPRMWQAVDKVRESFERLFQTDSPDTFDLKRFRHAATGGD